MSLLEKRVIKRLCNSHTYFSDLFEKEFLKDLVIEITNDTLTGEHGVKYYFKGAFVEQNETSKKLYDATERIVQTINLLEYLQKDAYIYRFHPSHGSSVKGWIGLSDVIRDFRDNPGNFVGSQYPDHSTANLVLEYTDFIFVSTQALKDYAKNDFKTPEEIRHNQNIRLAWTAIIISIVLALIALF